MENTRSKVKKRPSALRAHIPPTEEDRDHHLTGPFLPQTPLGSLTPRSASPAPFNKLPERSALISWVVNPAASFKLLLVPLVLYTNWELLSPYLEPGTPNPFSHIFQISGYVPTSSPNDPRYRKTWWDLVFIAYYVIVFSFIREALGHWVSRPVAKYFRLRRESKVDRFAEQMYALFYFMVLGAWGYRVMTQLPTNWYKTEEFWAGYPHWDMKPELKRYYLMQFAYWWQQLLVLVLGLEKPRKDYSELVAHHIVTLWLVGWSYLVNLTYIGNAVYMSMDIPDTFLAFSKLLNYIQWNTAKVYAFGIFYVIWGYFRHYLNLRILWSVWYELPVYIPEAAKKWDWSEGVYMPAWMRYQVFLPLMILQFLNLFWYYLMTKILIRGLITKDVDDERSDDEGEDGEDDIPDKKED
ncbi:hypothetical protein D9613_005310 [Agrocybe pediades]|uniref:TLC domain-containing protein n=1 Tax=Agrocybe pediades TaxID=84607 RepID=A0A8H4QXH6_9AGAR|nr:hypothetical protein D9613_005310 [Agrocybe pediades]